MPENNELPAPLTPADCDLRSYEYMPLDVVRLWDSDLATLASGDEFRAAVLLWCKSWHQVPSGSLPDDDKLLSTMAGYGRDMRGWKRMKSGAMRGWMLCSDGRWYHPVVAEKALEAWGHSLKQRDNARRRWGTKHAPAPAPKQDATAYATGYAMGDAVAVPPHPSGICQNDAKENENRINTPIPPKGASRFDEFWKRFPDQRKGDKAKCKKLWAKLGLDYIAVEVLAGLDRWLDSADWAKNGGEFIPGPHPWLNKAKWEASPMPATPHEFSIRNPTVAEVVAELQGAE